MATDIGEAVKWEESAVKKSVRQAIEELGSDLRQQFTEDAPYLGMVTLFVIVIVLCSYLGGGRLQ